MGRQFGSNCSLNLARSVLNRANSKQDRPKCVLISRGAFLNWIRLVCIRRNCRLNFVEHALNSADHGLNSCKTRPDCPDLRHSRVDSQCYLSGCINDSGKTRLLRVRAICIFCSSVWPGTGRTCCRTWVFLCGIRSLMWANGGNSRRNARYRGCVCVDRFVSWCFMLSFGRFRANLRASLKHNGETGDIEKSASSKRLFKFENLSAGRLGEWSQKSP